GADLCAMADMIGWRTFFSTEIAVFVARRARVVEDIGVSRRLVEVDGVRPGVRHRRLKSAAVPLIHLNGQSVVITQPGIFELVDTAVPGIDSCTISGSRIRSGYIPGAVQNRIRDGRPERSNVQVSDSVQPHAAPPQIRDSKINVRGDLPLEGDIRLMGVRVPQVLIRKSDIHRSR